MKLQAIAILTFLTFANVMAQETTTTKYKFNRYGTIGIDTGMG